ncbi:hypothetical protein RhiirC2_124942 [Rhizophagus irregularis]|uniref:Uncharacterized protein n=1 Tax=Rhizophagus irregularis TaxID=588596 RepID=A0A2N1MQA1_9GLOM|nr:hypothetical protein RhiirC2_124942 [Rhizophagus irregularis]
MFDKLFFSFFPFPSFSLSLPFVTFVSPPFFTLPSLPFSLYFYISLFFSFSFPRFYCTFC